MTETEICNLGLGKIGGAGDVLNGNAFIASINGKDKVSTFCKFAFPRIRRRVIIDLAVSLAPFSSTKRFASLGAVLSASSLPEIGGYTYAFNLGGNCLAVVRQFDEGSIASRDRKAYRATDIEVNYQWDVIANKAGSGKILVTDTLSNSGRDSAFIEYVIDTPKTGGFSEGMIDCIATLLASEISPVVGRDMESSNVLLAKYEQVVMPNAKKENLAGFNHSARKISNYLGGRNRTIQGI